jgi:hypothetical protein
VRKVLERSGAKAALGLLADLTGFDGDTLPGKALTRLGKTVDAAMRLVNDSARLQRQRIADTINRLDQAGKSIEEITAALRALGTNWAEGLAVQATTATLEGARDDAAASLTPEERADITRTWRTMKDAKVRPSHKAAEGQKRDLGEPFDIGGHALMHPGDPSAPLTETAGCRCRVVHRSKASGKFRPTPAGEVTRHPRRVAQTA